MKMTSVLASMCTLYFNKHIEEHFKTFSSKSYPKLVDRMPVFDCRVWNVPNIEEGANVFLWREKDATRNSIQMAAQSVYSPNELMNKDCFELQEMLFQKGINWNNYPVSFRRGTFIQRQKSKEKLTVEDLESLPIMHEARRNPDLEVERTEYKKLDMPPFGKVSNRAEVIFFWGRSSNV